MVFRRNVLAVLTAIAVTATAASPVFAADRRVKILNNTGYTIVKFYGSNKGSKSWEEDILGSSVLGPGEAIRIDFNDGTGYCKFDFKAVFNDGDEVVSKNINICEIGTYTYN